MKYPLFKVHVPVEDALTELRVVLESGFLNEGEQVAKLTSVMQKRFNTENLVLTNSCTSALSIALRLSGEPRTNEDSILTTPMTCVATNCPILTAGYHVHWVDINFTTGCMSPDNLRLKLQCDMYVRAVMLVAWAGIPPELDEIREICDHYNVPLIIDAAHAFGAKYKGRHIHEWGDFTCYSFQAIKHVTTGDGGMIVCRTKDQLEQAKKLKWFGIDRDSAKDDKGNWKGQRWEVDVVDAGYKFAMNNISAAIGLSQEPYIDDILSAHRKNAELYDQLFCTSQHVSPLIRPCNSEPSHWVYSMIVRDVTNVNRDVLLSELNKEGIGAGLVHVPNDTYTCFNKYQEHLAGVREFEKRQFSLPVGWWLSEDDIRHIAERVLTLVGE